MFISVPAGLILSIIGVALAVWQGHLQTGERLMNETAEEPETQGNATANAPLTRIWRWRNRLLVMVFLYLTAWLAWGAAAPDSELKHLLAYCFLLLSLGLALLVGRLVWLLGRPIYGVFLALLTLVPLLNLAIIMLVNFRVWRVNANSETTVLRRDGESSLAKTETAHVVRNLRRHVLAWGILFIMAFAHYLVTQESAGQRLSLWAVVLLGAAWALLATHVAALAHRLYAHFNANLLTFLALLPLLNLWSAAWVYWRGQRILAKRPETLAPPAAPRRAAHAWWLLPLGLGWLVIDGQLGLPLGLVVLVTVLALRGRGSQGVGPALLGMLLGAFGTGWYLQIDAQNHPTAESPYTAYALSVFAQVSSWDKAGLATRGVAAKRVAALGARDILTWQGSLLEPVAAAPESIPSPAASPEEPLPDRVKLLGHSFVLYNQLRHAGQPVWEYLPQGATADHWRELFAIRPLAPTLSLQEAVTQKIAEIKQRRASGDQSARHDLYRSDQEDGYYLEYTISSQTQGGVLEYTLMRYEQVGARLLSYQYARRLYAHNPNKSDIKAFLADLKANRETRFKALRAEHLPVPPRAATLPALHTVVIDSSEIPGNTHYTLNVSGSIRQVSGSLGNWQITAQDNDRVQGNQARGFVGGGVDGFRVRGTIQSIRLDAPEAAQVFVDGEPYAVETVAATWPQDGENPLLNALQARRDQFIQSGLLTTLFGWSILIALAAVLLPALANLRLGFGRGSGRGGSGGVGSAGDGGGGGGGNGGGGG